MNSWCNSGCSREGLDREKEGGRWVGLDAKRVDRDIQDDSRQQKVVMMMSRREEVKYLNGKTWLGGFEGSSCRTRVSG